MGADQVAVTQVSLQWWGVLKTELNKYNGNSLNILPKLLGSGLADPKESTMFLRNVQRYLPHGKGKGKGKAVPLQARGDQRVPGS